MKVCPICDTKFDEDIIRFCTKDGTPLVDVAEPSFVELPSESLEESEDDLGEVTVIRRKESVAPPPSIEDLNRDIATHVPAERIVIPTTEDADQVVRARSTQVYYPPARESNTMKVIALTVLGTIAVLGIGAALFWFLQKDRPTNSNVNVNTNLGSFNGNLGANNALDSNFNFNSMPNYNTNYGSGYNVNSSFNMNANMKTPSPTPTPKPSPSITPSPTPSESPSPTQSPRPSPSLRPSPSPTPRMGPRPTPNPEATPNK
ncbi:MAG: hypothetical protein ABJA02_16665 [Acidobacteriota bacterium]